MTSSRASQVDIDTTPYYHCIARCVRQAFLCGFDATSGRNFDHRKEWVLRRLTVMAEAFAIDVCAYAVMSNHLHLVLHVDPQRTARWSEDDIIRRVTLLFPHALAEEAFDRKRAPLAAAKKIALWRERLGDLSWFMRCLNEFIARRANREDSCKGRFWEGRFKSQALLDDGALLACMSYVDLNPVRAGIARGLEDSDWTSIRQRLTEAAAEKSAQNQSKTDKAQRHPQSGSLKKGLTRKPSAAAVVPLAPLFCSSNLSEDNSRAVNITLVDYVELLEWTGRKIHPNKRGFIKEKQPPSQLLARCQISQESWLATLENFHAFASLIGSPHSMQHAAQKFRKRWAKGQNRASMMYLQEPPVSLAVPSS